MSTVSVHIPKEDMYIWRTFKALAKEKNLTHAELFKQAIESYCEKQLIE